MIFAILSLLLLGGGSIRDFLLVLLIGITTGTYSSVFIASMFLVTWQQGDIPRAWRRLRGHQARRPRRGCTGGVRSTPRSTNSKRPPAPGRPLYSLGGATAGNELQPANHEL